MRRSTRKTKPLHAVATEDAVERPSPEHAEAPAIETAPDSLTEEPAVTALDDEAVAAAVEDSAAEAPAAENVAAADQDAEVVAQAEQPEPEPGARAGAFVFNPNSRATRFVWKIDAAGRFSEVSSEFAEAVGPHAADIIGTPFTDISALFNLDPEGKISEALARRDTWSGKTINWPIEGTSLAVPVDLAACPPTPKP